MRALNALIVVALVGVCQCAPLSQERVEVDPELTAGYYQGDIVLDGKRNGLRNETKRWPDNTVYYHIHGPFDEAHTNHILRGMRILEEVSCIRFKEASPEQKYFVNITGFNGGCYSSVGFLDVVQTYNLQVYRLDEGCFRLGTIVHEFLHTLGFYHMQSASNRDEYVRIATENISAGTEHNFNKYNEDTVDDFDVEYDYGSVLHYSNKAFSANGEETIIRLKNQGGVMGQRLGLAKSDIHKLNSMYRCPLEI